MEEPIASTSKQSLKRKYDEIDTSYGTTGGLPPYVSKWTLQNLTDIGLYYSRKGYASPLEILDSVPQICKIISDKCKDKMNYLVSNLDFELEIPTEGIFDRPERRVDIAMRLIKMLESNLEKLECEEARRSTKGYEYSNMYTSARHFLFRINDYIVREFYHQASYEQFFTDMMKKFGEIFSLVSESGASMKRVMEIGASTVISFPDIRFKLMKNSLDLRKSDWVVAVVSVVEVKELQNSDTSRNFCRPISDEDEFRINDYLSDKILGQHGGELLVEFKGAETCPHIIGMIVVGSKVIITSLKLSDRMYMDIVENGYLPGSDTVPINYSKPLDVFMPEDREILYEVFFRLSKTCCEENCSKDGNH